MDISKHNKNTLSIEDYQKIAIQKYKDITSKSLCHKNLYIKDAGVNKFNKNKGLGLFTSTKIFKGHIIQYCPSIKLQLREKEVKDLSISQYCYWHYCQCDKCKKDGTIGLIPLGYGGIINTADDKENSNCTWFTFPKINLVVFLATKNIEENEEILTWWGEDYYNHWCI